MPESVRCSRARPRPGALPAGLLTLLALFPATSRADVGDLGAIVDVVLMAGLVIWGAVALFVGLWVCRRQSVLRRVGWSVLVFCFPAICVGVMLGAGYLLDQSTRNVTELTKRPVDVLDATFPAGSTAVYEQTGGLFGWGGRRTLLSIRSPQPVLLDNVRVAALTSIPQGLSNEVRVDISPSQTLDGWPCEGDAVLDLRPTGATPLGCTLSAAHLWHGQ
ncbi:MAG: hypothetical protein V4764_21410 [Burkholderia sp.]